MSTKLEIKVIDGVAPVTLAKAVKLGDGTDKDILDFINSIGGGSNLKYNFALTGSNSYVVDFDSLTITISSWVTYTNVGYYTKGSSTINIPSEIKESSFLNAGSLYYFVSDNSGNYKFVKANTISTDSGGNLIFALCGTTVYPLLYPFDLIKVVGGSMYNHTFKSIGKVVLIGDSITFGGCMDVFSEQLVVKNLASSGKTVRGDAGLTAQADLVTSDYSCAIVMGGTNDEGTLVDETGNFTNVLGELTDKNSIKDKTTFFGAYQYIIEKLYEVNPKIKILICCPPRAWNEAGERINLEKVGEAVKEIAKLYSIPYVDLWYNCPINEFTRDTYLKDKLHPNGEGNSLIGNIVKGEFVKAYCGGIV